MRTMSWSRYHSLSWSFMRLRAGLRHDRIARAGRKTIVPPISAADLRRSHPPDIENAGAGRPAPRESDPPSGCFRTKTGPRDTDV
jgi:hypothetical protein